MEASKEQILWEGYGLKLIGDTRVRTGRICKTNKGLKELRKLNCDEKRAHFTHCAQEHIFNNGFHNGNRFLITCEGMPYYKTDGDIYVLEEYEDSQYIDMEEKENLLKSIRLMAKFHNAAQNFNCDDAFYNYGKADEQLDKRLRELNRIKKWINKQSNKSVIDIMVMKNIDYYKNRVEEAKSMICSKECSQLVADSKAQKYICHNNFKSETILSKADGSLILTGFDKCAYDCVAVDLSEFFRRYMKQSYAQRDLIYLMVEEYSKIRPLSSCELMMIKGMLIYPKKFFKLCNQYYNKRRVFVSEAMTLKLSECIQENKKNADFLDALILR